MQTWQLQEAKARLSEVIDLAEKKGPQMITRRGVETAVILPIAEWRKIAKPMTMLEILQARPRIEIPLPARGRMKRRKAVAL